MGLAFQPFHQKLVDDVAHFGKLGLDMPRADLHGWRLDDATQLAAVRDALDGGTRAAKELRRRFAEHAPHQIARELAVPIEKSNDDPMVGSLWRFAEHQRHPIRILIYSRGLVRYERPLLGTLADRILGEATAEDVFVAHELFHHAELSVRSRRSHYIIDQLCFELAPGIGAPALRHSPRWQPARLRSRCSTFPPTPEVPDLVALGVIRRKV